MWLKLFFCLEYSSGLLTEQSQIGQGLAKMGDVGRHSNQNWWEAPSWRPPCAVPHCSRKAAFIYSIIPAISIGSCCGDEITYQSNSAVWHPHLSCTGTLFVQNTLSVPKDGEHDLIRRRLHFEFFWVLIHHSTSTLCVVILLVVSSDKSRFHHLLRCAK